MFILELTDEEVEMFLSIVASDIEIYQGAKEDLEHDVMVSSPQMLIDLAEGCDNTIDILRKVYTQGQKYLEETVQRKEDEND